MKGVSRNQGHAQDLCTKSIVQLRRRKSLQPYRLGKNFPENVLDLWLMSHVLVHSELAGSHQCAQAAKILGCVNRIMAVDKEA